MILIALTREELLGVLTQGDLGEYERCTPVASALMPDVVIAAAIARNDAGEDWFWCAPRLFCLPENAMIVGVGCFKNSPRSGEVEIGYGVAETCFGRGFAMEGVAQMVSEALQSPGVSAVTAETSVDNRASERVLEKNHFQRMGTREDPEDGRLTRWKRSRG